MKEEQIIKKVRELKWEPWLDRPFDVLVTSFFAEGFSKKCFKKIGINNMSGKASLYQNGKWYESKNVWKDGEYQVANYLKNHTIFDITNSLDKFYKKNKSRIKKLGKGNPIKEFKEVFEILELCTTYIWLAHSLEDFYKGILNKEVPKYIKGDIDKFVGDASFPKKKNIHTLMEDSIRAGNSPKKIAKEFGWIKARFDLIGPFNEGDIQKLKSELEEPKHVDVKIPKPLQKLFDQIQELVFYRTARTDVFYELYFLSRPVLKHLAKYYKIPFKEISKYSAQSLINGKPKKFGKKYSYAFYEGDYYLGDEPILEEDIIPEANEVKGTIAFKGKVKGTVKIVTKVEEINKVKKGNVLVTQMTFPSYIPAMVKAVAFVTDEGGITCHAAIVAREMNKPCIIGTKVATKIFKDGDLVEVDAIKGVIKKC